MNKPSALLSNARATVATLIQRPNSVTTSNAFDECAILDRLIDVSNDVDRFEDGESRKFLNIAQVITASTCIYSRRVDALYKLIHTFQSSPNNNDENASSDEEVDEITLPLIEQLSDVAQSESPPVVKEEQQEKTIQEKKKKSTTKNEHSRSFICTDPTKITLNPSKVVFRDRTSSYEHKLFQNHVPFGNKPFWMNDIRPIIFDLLFDDKLEIQEDNEEDEEQKPERLADALHRMSPAQPMLPFDEDIPLPISTNDDNEVPWVNESIIDDQQLAEKKKQVRIRSKKSTGGIDIEIFRRSLTDEEQALFRCSKRKPIASSTKIEQTRFFIKPLTRQHFDALIQDCDHLMLPKFVYPTINKHHLTIRERYSTTTRSSITRTARSPPVALCDVLDDNAMVPLPSSPLPSFTMENNVDDDDQDDGGIRLQSDMEQLLNAACQSSDEQEQNKIFLSLRSSIHSYINEHSSTTYDVNDLIDSFNQDYALPLVFSQLLHLCASTQRYHLRSTSTEQDKLFIEKII